MPASSNDGTGGEIRTASVMAADYLHGWKANAIQTMVDETGLSVEYLVLPATPEKDPMGKKSTTEFLHRLKRFLVDKGAYGWYWAGRAAIRKVTGRREPYYRRRNVHVDDIQALSTATRLRCSRVPTDGFGRELPSEAVEALTQTDVCVMFDFGFLVGDALDAPTYGILSFHHGDFAEYRGKPAGFWEFMHDRPTVGVTVQRINDTLDGGEVVAFKDVDVSDAETWQEVQRRIKAESHDMLASAIQNITSPDESTWTVEELGPLYTTPTATVLVRYLVKNNLGKLKQTLREHW